MDDQIRIEDMAADEIAELLQVSEDDAEEILAFVESVGGIENAFDALESLKLLKRAA